MTKAILSLFNELEDGKYNVAIVFSSSIKGDLFEGAAVSTLYIDEVELSYRDIK